MDTKKKPIGDPNSWHIVVYPRQAGNFGYCSISSIKYDTREAENLAENIQEQIKRHVDNVSSIDIQYDNWICAICKNHFDTYQEAENCKHN